MLSAAGGKKGYKKPTYYGPPAPAPRVGKKGYATPSEYRHPMVAQYLRGGLAANPVDTSKVWMVFGILTLVSGAGMYSALRS